MGFSPQNECVRRDFYITKTRHTSSDSQVLMFSTLGKKLWDYGNASDTVISKIWEHKNSKSMNDGGTVNKTFLIFN